MADHETLEETERSLPTPPYTSCKNQNSRMSSTNPDTMSRSELMEYCGNFLPSKNTSQSTQRLRTVVFSSMFERLTASLTIDEITKILLKSQTNPDSHKSKRLKQLYQVVKNHTNKIEFLTEMMRTEDLEKTDDEQSCAAEELPTPPYTTLGKPPSNPGLADQEAGTETIDDSETRHVGAGRKTDDAEDLPTPPYTAFGEQTGTNQGLADQVTVTMTMENCADEGRETRQGIDYSIMSRHMLQEYCCVNLPRVNPKDRTERLRAAVYNTVFDSLVKQLGDEQMVEIM
jgi:hypothetical protein